MHEASEALLLQGALARRRRRLALALEGGDVVEEDQGALRAGVRGGEHPRADLDRAAVVVVLEAGAPAAPEGLELGAQVDRLVEALPEHVGVAGARGKA